MSEIVLSLVAGLVLFLYAVRNLSDSIENAAGGKAKYWIEKFTKNTLLSLLTGIVITTLLDSSSAVIIITIVLVNAGILSLRQAMVIVLGANIGTTFSSQIIAMDISKYSPVLLFIGFGLIMISKTTKLSQAGQIILYFGVLFFGLFTMENAVEPLKDHSSFNNWMKSFEKPLTGALAGALTTLVIQSSSATVGIAIILAKKGFLTLQGGIAVMLGAELGTCSDTLLATINGSKNAVRTGFFHLFFNLITIIFGLILFDPFMVILKYISDGASIERSIANGHMLFNFFGVILFIWFIPFFESLLMKIIRD